MGTKTPTAVLHKVSGGVGVVTWGMTCAIYLYSKNVPIGPVCEYRGVDISEPCKRH